MAAVRPFGPEGCALILATVPLVEQDASNTVVGACSGVLLDDGRRRVLVTVKHATGNGGRWSVISSSDARTGSTVLQLGAMHFLACFTLGHANLTAVDLAYSPVPHDFLPRFQLIDVRTRQIQVDEARLVFSFEAIGKPTGAVTYGFAGTIKTEPLRDSVELFADYRLERELQFTGEDADWYYFALGHLRGNDIEYKGTSGAPILSPDGDIVGIVAGPGKSKDSIRAVPLDRYVSAIMVDLLDYENGAV